MCQSVLLNGYLCITIAAAKKTLKITSKGLNISVRIQPLGFPSYSLPLALTYFSYVANKICLNTNFLWCHIQHTSHCCLLKPFIVLLYHISRTRVLCCVLPILHKFLHVSINVLQYRILNISHSRPEIFDCGAKRLDYIRLDVPRSL